MDQAYVLVKFIYFSYADVKAMTLKERYSFLEIYKKEMEKLNKNKR